VDSAGLNSDYDVEVGKIARVTEEREGRPPRAREAALVERRRHARSVSARRLPLFKAG
jgi:hypothetical protein